MARKMKDSGIEWIGEIPEGWSVSKVLHCLSMPITDGPHTTPILYDTGIPFVSAEAVSCGNGRIDFSHIRGYISEQFYKECCQKYVPEIDDIYMIKSGATTGRVAIVDTTRVFTIWSPLAVFRCNKDCMLPKFLYYYLQSPAFQKEVEFGWTFGTQQNVGMRSLEQMKVCVPQLNKQDTIANYLDYQCSQIDLLLQKALTSIEEHKKLKQAVITQAVTKGVRGEREMKDSGVEWIGEIPKEWDIIKSSRIIKTTQNGLSRRDLEKSEGQIILKLKNITSDGKIDYSFLNRITLSQNELNTYALTTGDFLFVRVNGSKSLVGKCAIFEAISEIVAYNDHIIRVKLSNQCYNRFFLWYLYSCCGKAEIDLHTSTAAGQYTISGDGLRDITLVFPPIDEQKEIADYLDAKCAEIDGLIAKKEQLVKELESYKKSLIYEVVTGKREV